MPKKNKPVRVKLIANPGAGNVKEAASKIEQVTCYLIDAGLKVDVALAKRVNKTSPPSGGDEDSPADGCGWGVFVVG